MLQGGSPKKTVYNTTAAQMDDVMIQDPFCEIYFPKKDGVHLRINGKDLYFCSEDCRDKFLEKYKKNRS
jgi:YHS domain-containing protein